MFLATVLRWSYWSEYFNRLRRMTRQLAARRRPGEGSWLFPGLTAGTRRLTRGSRRLIGAAAGQNVPNWCGYTVTAGSLCQTNTDRHGPWRRRVAVQASGAAPSVVGHIHSSYRTSNSR